MINNDLKKIYQKSKEDFYQELSEWLIKKSKKIIITANPETFMISEKDQDLKKILSDSNNSLVPDGIAIVKACQKLGINIKERITGIEICEYFDLNPYQLMSTGAMLIASDQGQELVRELQTNGIQAAVIGRTSDSREKLIYRQGKAANLEITRNDEFYKIK